MLPCSDQTLQAGGASRGGTSQLKLWVLEEGRVMERPHCAPQRSSRKQVSDVSSSTSLISSCTTPSACGGAGFSHFGFCAHARKRQGQQHGRLACSRTPSRQERCTHDCVLAQMGEKIDIPKEAI